MNEESFENVEHEEDVKGSESVVLERILQALEKSGFKDFFLIFFELILDGKYPLDNISLILFLETVQFFWLSNYKSDEIFPWIFKILEGWLSAF